MRHPSVSLRRRWPHILLGLLLGLPILLAGIGLVWLRVSFSGMGGQLDTVVAEARAQKIATNPDELRLLTHLENEDNAAELYRQAFAEIKKARAGGADKEIGDFLSGESTPKQDAQVVAYLKSCGPAIEKLELGARKKGADWNYKWEEGPMLLFPEMAEVKGACKLLCARAVQRSRAGDTAGAYHDLETAASLTNALARTPTLIGILVQIASGSITLSATETVLRAHHDPTSLGLARRLLNRFDPPDLARGFEGELVLNRKGIQGIEKIAADTSETDAPLFSGFPESYLIRDPNFRRAMEAWGVRFWTKAVLAARKENFSPEQRAAIQSVESGAESDMTLVGRVAGAFVAIIGQSADATARFEAQRRSLLGSLDVYAVGIPARFTSKQIDPFTGKALVYSKNKKGFRLYSLGPNLADDGGITRREASKKGLPSDKYDVGVVFEK